MVKKQLHELVAGDYVKCLDSHNSKDLNNGYIYKINKIIDFGMSESELSLEGVSLYWKISRFEHYPCPKVGDTVKCIKSDPHAPSWEIQPDSLYKVLGVRISGGQILLKLEGCLNEWFSFRFEAVPAFVPKFHKGDVIDADKYDKSSAEPGSEYQYECLKDSVTDEVSGATYVDMKCIKGENPLGKIYPHYNVSKWVKVVIPVFVPKFRKNDYTISPARWIYKVNEDSKMFDGQERANLTCVWMNDCPKNLHLNWTNIDRLTKISEEEAKKIMFIPSFLKGQLVVNPETKLVWTVNQDSFLKNDKEMVNLTCIFGLGQPPLYVGDCRIDGLKQIPQQDFDKMRFKPKFKKGDLVAYAAVPSWIRTCVGDSYLENSREVVDLFNHDDKRKQFGVLVENYIPHKFVPKLKKGDLVSLDNVPSCIRTCQRDSYLDENACEVVDVIKHEDGKMEIGNAISMYVPYKFVPKFKKNQVFISTGYYYHVYSDSVLDGIEEYVMIDKYAYNKDDTWKYYSNPVRTSVKNCTLYEPTKEKEKKEFTPKFHNGDSLKSKLGNWIALKDSYLNEENIEMINIATAEDPTFPYGIFEARYFIKNPTFKKGDTLICGSSVYIAEKDSYFENDYNGNNKEYVDTNIYKKQFVSQFKKVTSTFKAGDTVQNILSLAVHKLTKDSVWIGGGIEPYESVDLGNGSFGMVKNFKKVSGKYRAGMEVYYKGTKYVVQEVLDNGVRPVVSLINVSYPIHVFADTLD